MRVAACPLGASRVEIFPDSRPTAALPAFRLPGGGSFPPGDLGGKSPVSPIRLYGRLTNTPSFFVSESPDPGRCACGNGSLLRLVAVIRVLARLPVLQHVLAAWHSGSGKGSRTPACSGQGRAARESERPHPGLSRFHSAARLQVRLQAGSIPAWMTGPTAGRLRSTVGRNWITASCLDLRQQKPERPAAACGRKCQPISTLAAGRGAGRSAWPLEPGAAVCGVWKS
jgi:hypothetical protein